MEHVLGGTRSTTQIGAHPLAQKICDYPLSTVGFVIKASKPYTVNTTGEAGGLIPVPPRIKLGVELVPPFPALGCRQLPQVATPRHPQDGFPVIVGRSPTSHRGRHGPGCTGARKDGRTLFSPYAMPEGHQEGFKNLQRIRGIAVAIVPPYLVCRMWDDTLADFRPPRNFIQQSDSSPRRQFALGALRLHGCILPWRAIGVNPSRNSSSMRR